MKWLQAADAEGRIRLGYLDGTQAHILRAPHQGIETTLDLLVAIDEKGVNAQQWLASARGADLFDRVTWQDLEKTPSPRSRGEGTSTAYALRYPVTPPEVWG